MTCASFINRYEEHGGGDLESFSWAWTEAPAYARIGEVETLDGFVLALSPWVVATSASTSRWGSSTATTSISACRSATRGAR